MQIDSKEKLGDYLDSDQKAQKRKRRFPNMIGDDVAKFIFVLRHYEYCINTRKKLLRKIWGGYTGILA